MVNKIITTFIFALMCSIALAQNKFTDSLIRLFPLAKQDSTRTLIMADLCYFYRYTNIDSSLFYGESALKLAQKINFLRGEADALNKLGLTYREKGDLPKSLELQFQALKIAKDNNYVVEIANCFRRIGHVYMDLNDYAKAAGYSLQALKIDTSIRDARSEAIESMDLGDTYQHMNRSDSASYYVDRAFEKINLIEDLAPDVYRVLGNIEAGKGNKNSALSYYQKGIEAGLKINDYRTISFIYANTAIMFKKLNQPDSSIWYAKKALGYGQITSYRKGILLSGNLLSELYDSIDPKQALGYYKISAEAKDSLFGAGNIQTIQTLIAQENERQKEIETAKEVYKNQLKQYGLLTGLAVILIIALILYRNNSQKEKANKVLETALANLKSAQSQLIQSEKMASLGEMSAGIAHEIQNPLNFVNNFSEVNKEMIEELKGERLKAEAERNTALEDELIKDIEANSEKINHHGKRADAIVKGMLQHSRSVHGADGTTKEPTDINALCDEYLRLAFHSIHEKDKSFNATLKTDFDPSIGKVNMVQQDIGSVLLNLYNNAFYATSAKNKAEGKGFEPSISVSTKKMNDKIQIRVSDNGSGIPQNIADKIFQPFFTTKPAGEGTGLGLSLSYDIIKAHGGAIKVETKEKEGTMFIIQLPA